MVTEQKKKFAKSVNIRMLTLKQINDNKSNCRLESRKNYKCYLTT
jgi:hypothetical protein